MNTAFQVAGAMVTLSALTIAMLRVETWRDHMHTKRMFKGDPEGYNNWIEKGNQLGIGPAGWLAPTNLMRRIVNTAIFASPKEIGQLAVGATRKIGLHLTRT